MIYIIAVAAAAVAAVIVEFFFFVGKVNRLEAVLTDHNASVALQIVDFQDRLAKVEVKLDADYIEMEEHIADRIEKKWDDGLQSILNFNPFAKEGDE